MNGGNVHKHKNTLTIFDFDACGFGWRSYELAAFLWNIKMNGVSEKKWELYIDSYLNERKLISTNLIERFFLEVNTKSSKTIENL